MMSLVLDTYIYIYTYIHIYIYEDKAREIQRRVEDLLYATVDFRNFIVFSSGRDPGTLKSDIVSKKSPQSICSDLRLSN